MLDKLVVVVHSVCTIDLLVCVVWIYKMNFFLLYNKRITYIIASVCLKTCTVLIFMAGQKHNIFEHIKSFLTSEVFCDPPHTIEAAIFRRECAELNLVSIRYVQKYCGNLDSWHIH